MINHVVNISGGKDSAATYLKAIERRDRTGQEFRAVMADTGHEHELTIDFVDRLPARTGGPLVEVVKADFTRQMQVRRDNLQKVWGASGIPQEQIDRARDLLVPTGIPFLDLCMMKGRFPSTMVRFCTSELKAIPLEKWQDELLKTGDVVRWQGERRQESKARSNLPMFSRSIRKEPRRSIVIYRPIVFWAVEQVFALHAKHNLAPNPLYLQGMSRVGCFPCVMAVKSELSAIAVRYPEAVEKLMEWESIVAAVSKQRVGTFFAGDKTPEGREMSAAGVKGSPDHQYPNAREVFQWAKTDRGGRQFNLLQALDEGSECTSQYGLCE